MPKLRLFRDDPLDSDAILFPRSRREEDQFELRLVGESIREVEGALERVQAQLDDARRLVSRGWYDDDGPRAA